MSCNGKLFFIIGTDLWESSGTQEGTHKVTDDIFSSGTTTQYSQNLVSVGNQLFFTASTIKYGRELYAGIISKPGVVTYFSVTNGNWNNPATWAGNVVPPEGASVIVRHDVTGNVNTTCNELRIEEPGKLNMNAGISISVLQ